MNNNQQKQVPQQMGGMPPQPNMMMGFPPQVYQQMPSQPMYPGPPQMHPAYQAMLMQPQQMMQAQQFQNRPQVPPNAYRQKQPGMNDFPQMVSQGGMPMQQNQFGLMGLPQSMIGNNFGQKPFGIPNGGAPQGPRPERTNVHSLYVGNLSNKVFDLDLYKFFQSAGYKISSARVIFDKESKKTKGFGYLNFHDEEETNRCLENMNNAEMDGKQIVLCKKRATDFDQKANVLVKNLPKEMDQKELSALFSPFGDIISCKLEVFNDGKSRNFGYVQFENKESAEKAITQLNDTVQGGKKIEVSLHTKKEERQTQGEKYTNLFVQNFPANYSQQQLLELFQQFGEIDSALLSDKPGQAFVNFKDHNSAKKAIDEVNLKLKIENAVLLVSPHIYRQVSDLNLKGTSTNPIVQNQKEMFKSNIYVRFIPKEVKKDEIENEFKKAGPISSIKLKDFEQKINGETVVSYQIGYILYENVKSAQKSIQMFDNNWVFGFGGKPLKVEFWQAKDDLKQARDEKQFTYVNSIINYCKQQAKTNPANTFMGQPIAQFPNQPQVAMGPDGTPYRGVRGGNRGGPRGTQNRGGRGGQQTRGGKGQQSGQPNRPNSSRGESDNQGQIMGIPQQQATPQVQHMQVAKIDTNQLNVLQGEDRNDFVGNAIYPPIMGIFGQELAPTITGMLLDETAVDFKQLLTDNQYFTSKAHEAYAILMQSKAAEGQ